MKDTIGASHTPGAAGLTREQLLRRTAVGGGTLLLAAHLPSITPLAPFAPLAEAAGPTPKRGGTFRLGVAGGSAKDIIDGQYIITDPDIARMMTGWESLVVFDSKFKLQMDGLAEEITSNARGDVWTIRVRAGVEFHNGKPLTSADVRYSLQRVINPKLGLGGQAFLSSIDPHRIDLLDNRTVRLNLTQPDGTLLDGLAQYTMTMVPVGYSPNAIGRAKPNIGTGPYKLQSFTPGQQSVHVRNPNYWRTGQPSFDEVVIIDFPDDSARVNALLGGQVDAITNVPPAQVLVVNAHAGTHVLESPSGDWTPICMRVDTPPFNDVRVRQAMRLIANRPQMVEQALAGHGYAGNDLYAPFDEDYNRALPQRQQDIAQAKSLLKAAGRSDLTIDLMSTNGALGMNEGAQVFAQQAKAAGVTINVRALDSGTFYGNQYLKWVFSTDFWDTRNYLAQVAAGSLPTSPYDECHWPDSADRRFISLFNQAKATVDRAKQREIIDEMQKMEYDAGGYIIWGFHTTLDGYSSRLQGLKTGYKSILPLNMFGNGYRTIWFG